MKKLTILSLAFLAIIACSKDDDDDSSGGGGGPLITATVDGQSFRAEGPSISSANSGGTTQINGVTSDDIGFKFFLPETAALGLHDLDTSSIGVTYSDDWNVFGNYQVRKGTIMVNSFQAWPAALNATFEGWGYKNTNPDDSIYISNGNVSVTLN